MHAQRWGAVSRSLWVGVLAGVVMGVTALAAPAQTDVATRGRDILTKYSDAVITVKISVKVRVSMEGREEQEEENSSNVSATVIDPSGLAVCALSEADPTHAITQMMGDDPSFKFEMDVTDVKMRLADGKELPAKIVLRDKDLDLAFIRPIASPAAPLTALDLAASASTDVLEETFIINRMAEVANRVPILLLDRISGVVKKPRLMYLPGPTGQYSDLGCPILSLEGKVVGIMVNRFPPPGVGEREDRGPLSVIMPAADVADIAKQAPAAEAVPSTPETAAPAE